MTPLERADRAREMLESPVFKAVFEDIKAGLVGRLIASPFGDSDEHHQITLALQALNSVKTNFFGTGMAADAFFVAFRIRPNLWRRLVVEGSLTISFIPVYTEYMTQRSEEDTRKLTHIAFTIAGVVLLTLTLLGILFSPLLIRIVAPGWFTRYPETFSLTVTLNQIIFPYLFFMGLFALCMGILNSLRHFFAPAIAPIFLNISIILSVLLFYSDFKNL